MPITSDNRSFRDLVVSGTDGDFGESVRLSFMKDKVTDPDRASVVIWAVLRSDPERTIGPTGGNNKAMHMRHSSTPSELHIDPVKYSGPKIREGDRVRAMDRPGVPVFEVLSVDDRAHPRHILRLGAL